MKQALFILGLIGCYTIASHAQEPSFRPIKSRKNLLFAKEPIVTGFDRSYAIVEFETLVATPIAIAYYGVIPPEEELAYPRYRKSAKGSIRAGNGRSRTHQIKMNISKLESVLYDTGLIKNGGGVIAYRIEVFDPRIKASRLYDRHFRYKREGPPKTGSYTALITLTEGPFVDIVTHQSAVISWETDQASDGTVLVNKREVADTNRSTRHEVLVTGLMPDTQYVYRIQYSSELTREYSFHTAPIPGEQRPFKFGFMSDSRGGVGGGERAQNGVNAKDLTQFAAALYRKGSDFIWFGGDLVNGYTSDLRDFESQLETWKRAIQPVASRIPVYEVMGNHEQVGNYYKVFDPQLKKREYLILFNDREGEESTEASFAREFVNPQGSVYGFDIPSPEVRSSGLGGAETGPSYAESVYSFNYGNIHFVSLNSNYWSTGHRHIEAFGQKYADKRSNNIALKHLGGNREGYMLPNQLKWLERELQAAEEDSKVDWVFISFHEPAFPNGGHVRDTMYWGTTGKGELGGYNDPTAPLGDVIDMRNRFWTIVAKYNKVLAVLCGDEHNYSRTRIDSDIHPDYQFPVWQIVSGGCGAPYYVQDKSVPWTSKVESFAMSKHYCLFTVDGKRVGLTVHSDSGQTLDSVEDLTTIK